MGSERKDSRPPSRFTPVDIRILPPEDPETLWADPDAVEGLIAAISRGADTFDHLARHGPGAYPQGLARFGEQWARMMEEDLPHLEEMDRSGELARMDRDIAGRIDPVLRHAREPVPARYAALKGKLATLLPVMREHEFAEPYFPSDRMDEK